MSKLGDGGERHAHQAVIGTADEVSRLARHSREVLSGDSDARNADYTTHILSEKPNRSQRSLTHPYR